MSSTNLNDSQEAKLDNLRRTHAGAVNQYPNEGEPPKVATAAPQSAQWHNIPAELRERPQWCVAGRDKRPLTADGRGASSTDPSTWTDFDTACRAAAANGLGIGYMLHSSDPFTVIDMDVKASTSERVIDGYKQAIQNFDSYTEYSMSGQGFHLWLIGNIGPGARREGVEIYSQDRFIICTGNIFNSRPIEDRPEMLFSVVSAVRQQSYIEPMPDDPNGDSHWYALKQLIDDSGAFKEKRIELLFSGQWEGTYPSQSEADFALVAEIAKHTTSNAECWKAFQASALGKRDKAAKQSYMQNTMTKVRAQLAYQTSRIEHGAHISNCLLNWSDESNTSGTLTAKPLSKFLNEFAEIEFVVDDMFRRNWLYTMTGSTGSGKTGVAVSMCLCIASGLPIGKHESQAGTVLYIAGENPDDVRGRFRATLTRNNWPKEAIERIHVVDQSFLLDEKLDDLIGLIDAVEAVFVIVDTDQAVSLSGSESENDNGVRMRHAKNLRRLTRCESRPTILDLCHPNGAATRDRLVPRGGSSFLNEIDGNVGCFRTDTLTEVFSDPNKFRGAAFEVSFRKEELTINEVKDTKGRCIPVPVFIPATDTELAFTHVNAINDESSLLKVMMQYPEMPQVGWLEQLGWRDNKGEPNKPKISRMLKKFREGNLVVQIGNQNRLTPTGKKRAKELL